MKQDFIVRVQTQQKMQGSNPSFLGFFKQFNNYPMQSSKFQFKNHPAFPIYFQTPKIVQDK